MTDRPSPQLILLPGLGADWRQFGPQKAAFPDLLVPPWIVPKRWESLPDYAARLARTIPPGGPMVLGGSSFGGMLACEMARHLKAEAVVLIGSCRSPRALHAVARGLRPIVPWIVVQAFDVAKLISPLVMRVFSPMTAEQKALCVAMFKDMDSGFMKWASRAILTWHPSGPPPAPVLHIHGEKDHVMPVELVDADEVVPGGRHLINLTHAAQVNAFIHKAAEPAGRAAIAALRLQR